ncbi:MAG: DUF2079 domain-containing protein [Thermoplasmata archaeon]|nr:DUF2079 domain-containing protein [Thermoplasmata archaeon]MCI4361607.1 DUF2079 domain-containing protein [Thermoplasmata archaeon]
MPEPEVPPAADPDTVGAASPAPRWWHSPRVLLALMIAGFAAVSVYAGTISYYDFQTRNATDLTIFMQALTSTVRGHPWTLYESFDCMTKARCSFLLVHPSPVLYAAVPFYALAPTPVTLFAVQSVGVGLAAVPLYVLTRTVTGSSDKGLIAAGLYLLWAPTLGGEAFSFHLEAFLPLALFTVAMYWALGRYRLGLLAALVAFLVLEIAPVFAFLIGALFLSYSVERVLVSVRDAWRHRSSGSGPRPLRALSGAVRTELGRRDVRYTLGLMTASAAAFVVLFSFMNVWGARVLGVPAPPLSPGLGGIFFENSSPDTQSLGAILGGTQWPYTLAFWALLYALVAFVPFLAPRTLVVALPWIGYSVLTDTTRYVEIGSQYPLVAAVPIFIGLAYGLRRVPDLAGRWTLARPHDPATQLPLNVRAGRRHRAYRAAWVSALTVVLVGNVVLLPVNPLLSDLGITLADPFQAEYQDHSLTLLPGFDAAELLAGRVPIEATVTSPNQVFSLFANYPHAFELLGAQDENWEALPLNLSGGPQYVLVYPSFLHSLARNFSANLSNPARYGLEGWVGSTTVGPLLLYDRGATGPAVLYGPAFPPSAFQWSPSAGGLLTGAIGTVLPNASAPYGTELSAPSGSNRSGVLWTSPTAFLPPGNYAVRVLASAEASGVPRSDQRELLTVMVRGFGATLQNVSFESSAISSATWTELSFALNCTDPIPGLELQGFFHANGIGLAIGGVSIVPSGSS